MEKEIKRKVFLEKLPHSKSGKQVLWRECVGVSFKFIYDGISGEIKIIEYDKNSQTIILAYNNKQFKTKTEDVLKCRLAFIIGIKIREYRYNVGDIIEFKTGNIEIIERYKNNKGKRYKYKCLNCGQITEIQECMIGKINHCPVCCSSPQKVIKGINDISTTDSWMISFLKDKNDTYIYNRCSGKSTLFICPNCGFEKKMKISKFATYGLSCPKCSDGYSMPNKMMFNILDQLNIDFHSEKKFGWCEYKINNKIKKGIYDFYIPSKNLIIEMDGKQYKKEGNAFKINLKEQQEIDSKKDSIALRHGLEVIRIDCEYTDFTYIKNNISGSRLNDLLDLDSIDWGKVFFNSTLSKIKKCCEAFNNDNKDVKELAVIFHTPKTKIRKWLKKGTLLNWCTYDGHWKARKHCVVIDKSNK